MVNPGISRQIRERKMLAIILNVFYIIRKVLHNNTAKKEKQPLAISRAIYASC